MKISLLFLSIFVLFSGCASKAPEVHPSGLEIKEIKPNKWTAITKQNLLHLAQIYDLSPFLYTKNIQIQTQAIPHSHPVLTLNTRNAENPKKILSTFLHEELHWWTEKNKIQTNAAIMELKKIYPKAPVMKSADPQSTYLHLIVCYLELQVMEFYLGKKEARGIILNIMRKDKLYPWTYYQILYKDFAVRQVVKKHKLLPPPLK